MYLVVRIFHWSQKNQVSLRTSKPDIVSMIFATFPLKKNSTECLSLLEESITRWCSMYFEVLDAEYLLMLPVQLL